jgi:hypothetical protein
VSGRPISEKDNMALIGILSTQLLLHEFIHQKRGSFVCKPQSLPMYATS